MANAVAEPRPKLISIVRHPVYSMLLPVPILLDHLNSPFGVVLVGSDLYVADTDGILSYAEDCRLS